MPNSDASALKASQEEVEEVKQAAEEERIKLVAEYEQGLKEKEQQFTELFSRIDIEGILSRGNDHFFKMQRTPNFFSIHGSCPNRMVEADSHLCEDLHQHLIVKS